MGRTGITSDSISGRITMDDDWWVDREMECEKIRALHREPPKQWDIMQRIIKNHDVSDQHMYDVADAQREIEEENNDPDVNDEYNTDEVPATRDYIPQPLDEDGQQPDLSFFDSQELNAESPVLQQEEVGGRSGRQISRQTPYSTDGAEASRRSTASRLRTSANSGRGSRRRREFEGSFTEAFQGMADARRATVSSLRPDNAEDYKTFKEAFRALKRLPIEKFGDFCVNQYEL
ncbi:PREDICTED: uncharacterized protein LOC104709446 [Camelina sativa]|uniref:Uncharacterized protein LOC104709446 n=1 Tax=Camelina sativa TaxID=90675 RepID=A0ABM1QBX7_CAMSA|nr:PREDICTED: uncharacterized protein LOC104709446 [Camelina sativa]